MEGNAFNSLATTIESFLIILLQNLERQLIILTQKIETDIVLYIFPATSSKEIYPCGSENPVSISRFMGSHFYSRLIDSGYSFLWFRVVMGMEAVRM